MPWASASTLAGALIESTLSHALAARRAAFPSPESNKEAQLATIETSAAMPMIRVMWHVASHNATSPLLAQP
jgi:hypothetical protein